MMTKGEFHLDLLSQKRAKCFHMDKKIERDGFKMSKYSSPEETTKELLYLKTPFPIKVVEAAINQREEISPLLLEILDQAIKNEEELPENYMGTIFASYLLSQFREKKAFPLFVQIAELPERKIDDLIGADGITVSMHKFLASTYNGNLQELRNLIEQKPVNEWSKVAALKAIILLTNEKIIEKEEAFQYLNSLFTNPIFSKNKMLMAELVCSCCDISLKSFYDNIKSAFDNQMVSEEIITMKKVDSDLSKPQKQYGKVYYEQLIKDTVEELQGWYCFKNTLEQKEEEEKLKEFFHSIKNQSEGRKTGRNDPCHCGSGKKFKKCCLNEDAPMIH